MVEAVTVIRSLHILFAILWAGGGIHYARVTWPALRATSLEAPFIGASKHGPFMGLTSLGTVGFGLATYMMVGPDSYSSAGNAILGVGMLAAVVALINGFAGHLPTEIKIRHAVDDGDEDELDRLLGKEHVLGLISLGTVAVAILSMVTFRWF